MRMFRYRLPTAVFAIVAAIGLAPALADESGSAPQSFRDAALSWNPCPDFMPKGCGIAVVHGDPAGNESDLFFRVPAKSDVPLHWHTAAERMVLVDGRMKVAYEGRAPVVLTPGTYAYGAAKHPHSATCESNVPCVLFIAFDGPVDAHAGRGPAK